MYNIQYIIYMQYMLKYLAVVLLTSRRGGGGRRVCNQGDLSPWQRAAAADQTPFADSTIRVRWTVGLPGTSSRTGRTAGLIDTGPPGWWASEPGQAPSPLLQGQGSRLHSMHALCRQGHQPWRRFLLLSNWWMACLFVVVLCQSNGILVKSWQW